MKSEAVIYLDRNENLYGPAPKCYEVLRSISLNEMSVYSRDYVRGVKSGLSERLAGELNVPESQVLLGEGSEDLLKQAVHCYVGPGEKVLCPDQSWWYYRALASEVGGTTITYGLKEGAKTFSFDVEELIALYQKESPRVVLIASPNNPTGNSFPDDQLKSLVDAFRESIVILDEAYWGFGGSDDGRIAGFAARYRNLMVLRTFSKYYALAGARIGFAVVGTNLARLTKFAARYLGYNRISEALAHAALDSAGYYTSIRAKIQVDRQEYYDFFSSKPGFKCYHSDANFVLVQLPEGIRGPLQQFLRDHRMEIKFFADPGLENFVRITVGTQEQNKTLRGLISEFISAHSSATPR